MYKKETERLLFNGVHPSAIGKQGKDWERTWCSIEKLVTNYEDYDGKGYFYFINHKEHKLYLFEDIEDAIKEFNKKTCVWVFAGSGECMALEDPIRSW